MGRYTARHKAPTVRTDDNVMCFFVLRVKNSKYKVQ